MGAIFSATKPGVGQALGDYWVDYATGIPYFWDGGAFRGPRVSIVANQHGVVASNWAVTGYLWVCPPGQSWILRSFSTRYKTAGGSGCTLGCTVDASGTASGGGTAQVTAIDMTAAADTPYNAVLIATPTVIVAGSALSLVVAGTVTGLAYCTVNALLERLS